MMNKLIYITTVSLLLLVSCSDFLDTKNLYQKNTDNFYKTPKDMNEAMSGVYNALMVNDVLSEDHLMSSIMSDLMLGGGGPDDKEAKYMDNFQDPEEDTYKGLWIETYNGINRCNAIIESVTDADFTSSFKTPAEADYFKKQTLGEVYFMRGFLLFRAAKYFGGMPLILATDAPRNVARSSFSETFAQIASDIKKGIEIMPATTFPDIPTEQYGHANKWVAEGYMARVFLFYTGYMTNMEKVSTTNLPLAEGGAVEKNQVIAYLDDVINNGGYQLLSDFRNLWPYSYVNKSAGSVVLPWADKAGLEWAGQDGAHSVNGTGNTEVMFAKRYSLGNWTWTKGQSYSNRMCLYFGVRDNSLIPFGQGWGWGTIHSLFYKQWSDLDLRKKGSVLDMTDPEQGEAGYKPNKGENETGLFNKKYICIQHDGTKGIKGMFAYMYDPTATDMQLWNAQDFYYLRYADILLMQSELKSDASYMNQVRARAGLSPIGYSLDSLKQERMHEFAFEGLRWFDLLRWGDVNVPANNYYGKEINTTNLGIPQKYKVVFRPETKGLVSIPESEIRLSNGVYQQNPGW